MNTNEIEMANEKHLKTFEKYLLSKGLTKKTVNNHVSNVSFYINDFLYYYFEQDVARGCYKVDEFLGDWFIRKALWSSCAHIKSNAASLKKFYACMFENNVVGFEDYNELCRTIKQNLQDWLDEMVRYEEAYDSDF